MHVILDSAVFINATSFPFSTKDTYYVTLACDAEIKENLARLRLEAAAHEYDFHFQDPCMATIAIVQTLARKYGVKRLSRADESVIGLALELVDRGEKVHVYTDDFSLQNVLKWRKIPFSGVLQGSISKAKSFKKRATSKN